MPLEPGSSAETDPARERTTDGLPRASPSPVANPPVFSGNLADHQPRSASAKTQPSAAAYVAQSASAPPDPAASTAPAAPKRTPPIVPPLPRIGAAARGSTSYRANAPRRMLPATAPAPVPSPSPAAPTESKRGASQKAHAPTGTAVQSNDILRASYHYDTYTRVL